MYKIGEFAKLVNVSIKTLRYYDEINLFKPSYTEPYTNYRYYEEKQIEEINYIKKLKELNLSLTEIAKYVETKDMTILNNKTFELKDSLNNLNDYIDDEIYTIKRGDYNDYIRYRGLLSAETPFAVSLKNDKLKYYIVENENEYYFDLGVYKDDNSLAITFYNMLFSNATIVKKVFNYLFNDNQKEIIFRVHTLNYDYNLRVSIEKNLIVSKIEKEKESSNEYFVLTITGVKEDNKEYE